jgi:hypothetical protein
MRPVPSALVLALTVVVAASACSDSPTEPSARSTDLASAFAEMSLSAFIPAGVTFGVTPLPTATRLPANCAYSAAGQGFTCPTIASSGVTFDYGYALLSASGVSQSAFDAASTAAVRVTTSVVGSTPLGSDVFTIDSHQTMTLSGLLAAHHVLDGTETTHLSGTSGGYSFDERTTATVTSLVLAPAASSNPYPRSGTIALTLVDAGSAGFVAGQTMTVTLVFNGTSKVDVTLSPGGHCTLDLANPSAVSGCSLFSF